MISAARPFFTGRKNDFNDRSFASNMLLMLHGNGSDNGTVITDSSSYSRAFTNSNVITSASDKKFGNASLYFNGSNNRLYTTDVSGIDAIGDRDIIFASWVKPIDVNSPRTLIDKSRSWASNIIDLRFEIGMGGYFNVGLASTANWFSSYPHTVPINEWSHVAFSRHKNNVYMFINGLLVSQYAGSIITVPNNCPNLGIGNCEQLNDSFFGNKFYGYIDDMTLIIDQALSPSDFYVPLHEL